MADYTFYIEVEDYDGEQSGVSGFLVAADETAAQTRLQAIAEIINDLISGRVGDARLTNVITLDRTNLRATATASADKEIKGKFTFTTDGGYAKLISVPTFDRVTFTVAGGAIDQANATVNAFIQEVLTNGYSDNRFDDLTGISQAVEAFGRR